MCFGQNKVKTQQQQTKGATTPILAKSGNANQDLSIRSLTCYLYTTETTKRIDCLTKSKFTTTKQNSKHNNHCQSRELNRDLLHRSLERYISATESTVYIAVKLFYCFNIMGHNIKKQSQICGLHVFNKVVFCHT